SAFPSIFAPRPESNVFPGAGKADVFLADGGMFDNLPFLPAIEILSRAQRGYRSSKGADRSSLDFVGQRLSPPDFIIARALYAVPENADGARGSFASLAAIWDRASSLQHNIKIRAFEFASRRIYTQLHRLAARPPSGIASAELHPIDDIV